MATRTSAFDGALGWARYHCYAMAETGHILSLNFLSGADEESAQRIAASLLQQDPLCHVVEVWEVGHRIARLSRDPAGRALGSL
jgi:hypothetical protein